MLAYVHQGSCREKTRARAAHLATVGGDGPFHPRRVARAEGGDAAQLLRMQSQSTATWTPYCAHSNVLLQLRFGSACICELEFLHESA